MWEVGLGKKFDFQFQNNDGHIESHMDILNLDENETENLPAICQQPASIWQNFQSF